jgi:hypothetical protein
MTWRLILRVAWEAFGKMLPFGEMVKEERLLVFGEMVKEER